MNDFKSYSQNGKNRNSGNSGSGRTNGANGNYGNYGANRAGNPNAAGGADVKQTVDMATMIAKAFNGKSEGQVLQTILAQAEEGKRNGTLTNADLDNFYNTVSPMLDGFKRKKLKEIIAKLKAI